MRHDVLFIRCSNGEKHRFRVMYARSGCRNYIEFINKLLDMYEVLIKRYGDEKIDSILVYLREPSPIVIRQ